MYFKGKWKCSIRKTASSGEAKIEVTALLFSKSENGAPSSGVRVLLSQMGGKERTLEFGRLTIFPKGRTPWLPEVYSFSIPKHYRN